jgi:hypothetical protein
MTNRSHHKQQKTNQNGLQNGLIDEQISKVPTGNRNLVVL